MGSSRSTKYNRSRIISRIKISLFSFGCFFISNWRKTMKCFIFVFIAIVSTISYADVPHVFNTKEMSTATINIFVSNCQSNIDPVIRSSLSSLRRLLYCSCLADGLQYASTQKENNNKCFLYARTWKKRTPVFNIFQHDKWPASRLIMYNRGCMKINMYAPIYKKKLVCSCMGDYMSTKVSYLPFQELLYRNGRKAKTKLKYLIQPANEFCMRYLK